jgi:hypothetical protein
MLLLKSILLLSFLFLSLSQSKPLRARRQILSSPNALAETPPLELADLSTLELPFHELKARAVANEDGNRIPGWLSYLLSLGGLFDRNALFKTCLLRHGVRGFAL